jgi:hypothetical protein
MFDVIEIKVVLLPGGSMSSEAERLGHIRLVPVVQRFPAEKLGGHGIFVTTEGKDGWQSRGLLAAGDGGLWELVRRAAAWAAEEEMKQERP